MKQQLIALCLAIVALLTTYQSYAIPSGKGTIDGVSLWNGGGLLISLDGVSFPYSSCTRSDVVILDTTPPGDTYYQEKFAMIQLAYALEKEIYINYSPDKCVANIPVVLDIHVER